MVYGEIVVNMVGRMEYMGVVEEEDVDHKYQILVLFFALKPP